MTYVLGFAESVLSASGEGTTHLKLQKLLFYAYGAARAAGEHVPFVPFCNWQHGPVCVEVYERHKQHGGQPLPVPASSLPLPPNARDAVRVYGALSAWQLRNESHLEEPWLKTTLGADIPDEMIVAHFRMKFAGPFVSAPKNLAGSWSLSADGLPPLTARSLGELAYSLGR